MIKASWNSWISFQHGKLLSTITNEAPRIQRSYVYHKTIKYIFGTEDYY